MAIACGAAVANIYYAQPLLSTIAHEFSVSDGTAGLLVTASQVGYAAGLVLLVPLGDLLERRRLITGILLVTALALLATAAAPSFSLLAAALLVVGVTSVVAQILVPLASALAAESERGRVVGKVMSGLLVGILVARTASGLLAELGGWRLVFGVSAGATGPPIAGQPSGGDSADVEGYVGKLWKRLPRVKRMRALARLPRPIAHLPDTKRVGIVMAPPPRGLLAPPGSIVFPRLAPAVVKRATAEARDLCSAYGNAVPGVPKAACRRSRR